MKRFKLLNNIVGWIVFAIAAATYLMTIEPTASFWDCGEFISTAYKLEVGHPPGAPFFMLTARMFTLFASDPSQVAMMVNSFSALCSAFCILFLFWTITHITRKLVMTSDDKGEMSVSQMITILGAGAVGALAYTFTDTFWFSAVEGEVYAYSSLFTAAVFWAIFKWEDVADKPYANRWLVLIAYLMGLSISVHLLNLLTIPALVLVYYFKKYDATLLGSFKALGVSVAILVMVLYGIIPGFVEVAGWFELFFVNTLGFSFNTGTIVYAILLIGCLVWGIWETMGRDPNSNSLKFKKQGSNDIRKIVPFVLSILLLGIPFLGGRLHPVIGLLLAAGLASFLYFGQKFYNSSILNTILICCTVILLGYSSYAAIIIRSAANTPMDQNSPDDVFALKSYLNREQYGDTPLLFGESYASEYEYKADGTPKYSEGETLYAKKVKTNPNEPDEYEAYDTKKKYKHQLCMPFPRMYSTQAHHIAGYKSWGNIKGRKASYIGKDGMRKTKIVPTFGENLAFFFSYQVNFMYWRYFMWNFVGRQNDVQSTDGGNVNGNWISGINFIDSLRLGDQSNLPDSLANNKGRNTYYFLPLILGILGIVYQIAREKKENKYEGIQSFVVTFTLFFMTGLAIVLYLNQTPLQPRERDYAYAGSFYAFCIWIGLSVPMLVSILKKIISPVIGASIATVIGLLAGPVLLASQNWDDHDRSGRYTCRDFGQNYLLTMDPNGVIFTNGDNDTFPLWYNQEVEGVGTDQRVANLSYLQMGWYVDQMRRDAYLSKALPLTFQPQHYMNGRMDYAYIVDLVDGHSISLENANNVLVRNDADIRRKIFGGTKEKLWFYPAKNVHLDINKDEVVNSGTVDAKDRNKIVDRMEIGFGGKRFLGKQEIFILDLLATNHWERPMYFATTVGKESFTGINDYLQLEGMAYRIVPIKKDPFLVNERVNTDKMYDNMLHKFKWGGIAENPNIYLEENNLRMVQTHRYMFIRLVDALILEAKQARMKRDYCELLRWALTSGSEKDSRFMSTYRQYTSMYYDNSRIARGNSSGYSDSTLIAHARVAAIDILGNESRSMGDGELSAALKNYSNQLDTLALRKYAEERENRAIEVLDFAQKVLPSPQVPYSTASFMMAKQYAELHQYEKAKPILQALKENSIQHLEWVKGLSKHYRTNFSVVDLFNEQFSVFHEISLLEESAKDPEAEADAAEVSRYYELYNTLNK
ncbi:MAG: DUF2723 domain-containing protein [Paludibacteraceae bacterium]|nr:DUF2723 domain-containing protein [Paludibacteraceae bacterium]